MMRRPRGYGFDPVVSDAARIGKRPIGPAQLIAKEESVAESVPGRTADPMKAHMRHILIDKILTENKEVPFAAMQRLVRVSAPTLKRDLRYMREELGAPIVYSRSRNVYYYDVPDKSKPRVGRPSKEMTDRPSNMDRVWYTSDELFVLISMIEQLEALKERKGLVTHDAIRPLLSRIKVLFGCIGSMMPSEFLRRVRILDRNEPYRESEEIFETIGAGLCEHRMIRMSYYTASRDETTVREVTPQRLVHYDNRWYFDAYCSTAGALRTFAVENVRSAEFLERDGKCIRVEELEKELDGGYGLFHGHDIKEAVLILDKKIASYALRRQWHERQRVAVEHGGQVRLTVPYAAEQEIVHEILRWGGDIEVRSPSTLREAVIAEARRILARATGDSAVISTTSIQRECVGREKP